MSKARVFELLHAIRLSVSSGCPAHGAKTGLRVVTNTPKPTEFIGSQACSSHHEVSRRSYSQTTDNQLSDYAFEMSCSNIRYGPGVTKEIGLDIKNLKSKRVCVFTDKYLVDKSPVKTVLDSISFHNQGQGLHVDLFDNVRVEPTNDSLETAIDYAKKGCYDLFVAVGGGSVIDTCKAANLYACAPQNAELLDYVNAPLGKAIPIDFPLKPLIAVPTTSGTGSETTGTSVFDYEPTKAKTGISDRVLRPLLGIVDPVHTKLMSDRLAAYSGFDTLCHALESYTAVPYHDRVPRPVNPINRPAYQGSNPISDVWSLHALRLMSKYFKRSVYNADDFEARSQIHLASTFAGVGFGNAGCHLCHGLSYPISGNVKNYKAKDYDLDHPLIPHGLSVVVTAPAVFKFTAPLCPERHLEVAEILGADVKNVKKSDAGLLLSDKLREFMSDLQIDNGLAALGYTSEDIPALMKGTMPQQRVLKLAPKPAVEEDITALLQDSMTVY